MEELNKKVGNRLKECLKASNLTQKQLAELTGYTPQYISYIIVGKKKLSVEAARTISRELKIREEYLLCEDDYMTKGEIWNKSHELFNDKEKLLDSIINLAGYRRVCDYIANFKELGMDKIYGPFQEKENMSKYVPDEKDGQETINTVIEAPNGKRFPCNLIDYTLLEYELIEFINFRFKQLESRYTWLQDDGVTSVIMLKGSMTKEYEEKKVANYPSLLSGSLWVDHNEGMPAMGYEDEFGNRYSPHYDKKSKRWNYNNAEKYISFENE